MSEEIKVDVKLKDNPSATDTEESSTNGIYSVDMMDTMFADSLSRGMHNAIISQQNAQMASSASITSACARILQAATDKAVTEEEQKKNQPGEGKEQIEISIETKSDSNKGPEKSKPWFSSLNITPWLLIVVTLAVFVIAVSYLQAELAATNQVFEQRPEARELNTDDKSKEEK